MTIMIFLILFPLVCGLLAPFMKLLPDRRLRCAVMIFCSAVEAAAGLYCVFSPEASTGSFSFADGISVGFTSDLTAKLFCLIITLAWLLVSIYASVYMKHEKNEERFYLFMLLSQSAMLGAAFSDNLISMYFFYELVTLFSMPLVLHSLSQSSVAAAKKYLFYSVAGAFAALFGIFVLAGKLPSVSFVSGGNADGELSSLVLWSVFAMCIGFGAKAGLFPLHGWLPTAHPVAPAPASALLSGLIAKAGVLAIIRTVFFTVGADALRGTAVQKALLVLSLTTVFMGSMMAYKEKIFKKRLAYSTVSQISYVLTGLFLFSESGVEGALWQVIFHAAVKVGLFLCAGAVIYLYGKTQVSDLEGMGKKMPVTFVCFTVLSLSLIGIPPMAGFFSKWHLATASLALDGLGAFSYIAPAVLLLSALLTAAYLLPITVKGFWSTQEGDTEKAKKEPLAMTLPLIILSLIALFGGVLSDSVGEFISAVGASMF